MTAGPGCFAVFAGPAVGARWGSLAGLSGPQADVGDKLRLAIVPKKRTRLSGGMEIPEVGCSIVKFNGSLFLLAKPLFGWDILLSAKSIQGKKASLYTPDGVRDSQSMVVT